MIWSNEIDGILSQGVFLGAVGIENWALSYEEVLNALNQLLVLQIPILGGYVCELIDGVIQHNCDNWHCDKLPDELNVDFVNRSNKKAKEYIENYMSKNNNKIFFVLVPEAKS